MPEFLTSRTYGSGSSGMLGVEAMLGETMGFVKTARPDLFAVYQSKGRRLALSLCRLGEWEGTSDKASLFHLRARKTKCNM
jgi:hypothetical protein